ncbi:beta-lactamase domain protein [Paenibacillus curdlanolyticus YK9]|uniref:Beta-lactamase domain protein n=1 Tax=Paenibacillus curdlanolyticus YK9 TaxID=717606 RepID=E0IDP0_9BACL|nr:MBL fold metallo-hydrolase [Paenibacillus curdlanolyticus]EFM09244.1 beta-lactamase domain protein [Paenibacillus curdlanolyticus YK9]
MDNIKPLQVKTWNENWLQVKVPLPFSLRYVNSYVLPEPTGGYTVVDPGLHTPEAVTAWEAVFRHAGIAFTDIVRIIVTHQHPDHYGLAGLFQERSGAQVWMTEASHRYAIRMWGEHRELGDKLTAQFSAHGMPAGLVEGIADNLDSFLASVSPQPTVTYMKPGEPIAFGGIAWQSIDAPGHALGQLLFYDPISQSILCGDQVMPDITPNVSLVPDELDDPLDAFMQSLEELSVLNVSRAFPGHRNPFTSFSERCLELKRHHAQRLDAIVELLEEPQRQLATGFELCELLFGTRHRENKHNLRFAMAETLAHLVHLVKRGRIAQVERDGQLFFVKADRQGGSAAY